MGIFNYFFVASKSYLLYTKDEDRNILNEQAL